MGCHSTDVFARSNDERIHIAIGNAAVHRLQSIDGGEKFGTESLLTIAKQIIDA